MTTITLANIILSILETQDKSFVERKIGTLENQIALNEVDKRIIKDIQENLHLGNVITPEFIKSKYSYYAVSDTMIPLETLPKDAIDSAIVQLRISQSKTSLSKELLSIGSKVATLSPSELKEKISALHNNILIENSYETTENAISRKVDPYSDLVASRGDISLLIPAIEKHSGKASYGTTVSILAAPGHFKSAFALNVAYTNALAGYNMLYLTLEDTAKKLEMRLVLNHIACTAKNRDQLIDSSLLRDGKLSKDMQKFYNTKHNEMVDRLADHLIIWDSEGFQYDTFIDMEDTLRKADKMFMEKTGKGLDAVFIDHISLLKYTSGSGKKYGYDGAVINDWLVFFNGQALNFLDSGRKIIIFPLSQVKRDALIEALKQKKKGRYELDCAADASELERISTTMITLFKDHETRGALLINIPKAREGFVPDNPIQTEVYGEYFHVGPLDNLYGGMNNDISIDDFNETTLSLEDLIQ